ncbi:MAG TPA: Gfo/Idh/MocA family oxidoreductase [Acidimicrobiales bacterium]
MRVAVLGAGAVGSRAVRQLASTPGVDGIAVADVDRLRAAAVEAAIDDDRVRAVEVDRWADGADVGILCIPGGAHAPLAATLLAQGTHVVSASDELVDVDGLLALDDAAVRSGRSVVIGAGFSPGLTCLLAAHGAATLDVVEEIHVAKLGTAGPACARAHHRALTGESLDWRDGEWRHRRSGSGRELCWFPDPVGAQDCYRASAPDARLLVPAFAGVRRVTARVQATRRDRLTSRLPMLRRPHPEGSVGAVRVELRGRRGSLHEVVVLGAMDRPGVASGAVAAMAAVWAGEGRLRRPGAGGLAALADPLPMLLELGRRGVRAAVFEGRQPA